MRIATGNHLIRSNFLERTKSPVSGRCYARNRVCNAAVNCQLTGVVSLKCHIHNPLSWNRKIHLVGFSATAMLAGHHRIFSNPIIYNLFTGLSSFKFPLLSMFPSGFMNLFYSRQQRLAQLAERFEKKVSVRATILLVNNSSLEVEGINAVCEYNILLVCEPN